MTPKNIPLISGSFSGYISSFCLHFRAQGPPLLIRPQISPEFCIMCFKRAIFWSNVIQKKSRKDFNRSVTSRTCQSTHDTPLTGVWRHWLVDGRVNQHDLVTSHLSEHFDRCSDRCDVITDDWLTDEMKECRPRGRGLPLWHLTRSVHHFSNFGAFKIGKGSMVRQQSKSEDQV